MKVNGLVYAPTSVLSITGNGTFAQATTVVAGALVVQGTPVVVIGTPPAENISITGPATLPDWTVGRAYPTTTFTATGGGGIYDFTGSASLENSPVKGNQPDNCVNVPGC